MQKIYLSDIFKPLSRQELVKIATSYLQKILELFHQESKIGIKKETINNFFNFLEEFARPNEEDINFECNNPDKIKTFLYKAWADKVSEELEKLACEIANSLLDICIPNAVHATNLIRIFREEQETISFHLPDFREHNLHAIYTFLLGSIILEKLMPEIKKNWDKLEKEIGLKRPDEEKERRIFRSWIIASLFHDVGILLEKISEIFLNITKSYENPFKYKIIKVNSENNREDFESQFAKYIAAVAVLDEFSYDIDRNNLIKKNKEELFNRINEKIQKALQEEKHHDLISAFRIWLSLLKDIEFLWNGAGYMDEERMSVLQRVHPYKADLERKIHRKLNEAGLAVKELYEDLHVAIYAIALHTRKNKELLQDTSTINFVTHPTAFLLMLLDELQQFGRSKRSEGKYLLRETELKSFRVFSPCESAELRKFFDDNKISQSELGVSSAVKLNSIFKSKTNVATILINYYDMPEEDKDIMKKKLTELFGEFLFNGPSLLLFNTNKKEENKTEAIFYAIRTEKNSPYSIF